MNKQILIILTAFSFWSIQGGQGLGQDVLSLAGLLANVQLGRSGQRELTSEQQAALNQEDKKRELEKAKKKALKAQTKANRPTYKGSQDPRKYKSRGAAGSGYKK